MTYPSHNPAPHGNGIKAKEDKQLHPGNSHSSENPEREKKKQLSPLNTCQSHLHVVHNFVNGSNKPTSKLHRKRLKIISTF